MTEIDAYNQALSADEQRICTKLKQIIDLKLSGATRKIWHRHPVWFLNENPIVGYSKQKAGIRLMFWSGMSFEDDKLQPGTGKFKDASIFYNSVDEINEQNLDNWLNKAQTIQWDYKNLIKRKGKLERLL